jgi:hypothetical protein
MQFVFVLIACTTNQWTSNALSCVQIDRTEVADERACSERAALVGAKITGTFSRVIWLCFPK